MPRPRPTRRLARRPWYRIDLWTALDRLYRYISELLDPDPARRPVTCKPELTQLELRWLMDGRPLPLPVIFAGAGAGSTPMVVAYAADTGEEIFSKLVYAESFTGGVRAAAADFNRDGFPDLLVGPGPGGAPNVKVIDGKTGNPIAGPLGSFWAYEPWFTGGVNVAAADVDGDTVPDAILAAGIGGGPRVRVLSGSDGHVIADFFALNPDFRGGISVAAADLTGDHKAEVAIGAGEGGGPRVMVFDPLTQQPIAGPLGSFFAFDAGFRGGVFVGADSLAGDVDADGTFDLVVSAGPGASSAATVFSGATGKVLLELSPFGSFTGGVRTALSYVDNDSYADVVVGSGPGMVGTIRVFSGLSGKQLDAPLGEYTPFGAATGGITIAASNDPAFITVNIFYDANSNGSFDGSDTFVGSGVTVTLWLSGTQIASGSTDGFGGCTFSGLNTNTDYQIDVAAPANYTSEGPITANTGAGLWTGMLGVSPSPPPPPPATLAITGFDGDTGATGDHLTSDTTLTVFGTAPASSAVYLYERLTTSASQTQIGNTTASGGGLWTITYATPLAEGTHEFVAMPAATAPICSPFTGSAPDRVTIDTTAPTVWLTAPSSTYETIPEVRAGGWDLKGLASTVVLDVDLNNDSDYLDAGESGYASGTLTNGTAVFSSYSPLTVGNTVRMQARLLDAAGNQGTSSASTVTVNTSPTNYPVSPPIVPATVSAAVSLYADGTVTTFVPVDVDRSPSSVTGTPAGFVYVSSQTGLAPVVGLQFQSNNALTAPTQIVATLTWDGASAGGTTFSGTGLVPGALWMLNLQPAASQSTGLHTYTVDAFIDYPGSINDTYVSTGSGSTFLVNRSSGVNGAGWAYSDVDRLVTVTGGKMRVYGNGQWSFYATSGGGYDSPPGDAGILAAAGGGFTYTLPSGEQRVFDSSGYQTKWIAFDGSATLTYTYDGSSRLETVQSPDGGVATFAYSSGLLQTVTAPGNRVTTFSYTGTDLTLVTDPAGGTHTLAYDGSHRLTDEQWGNLRTTYGYLSGMGVRRASGAEVNTVQPVLGASLTDPASRDVYVLETDGLGNTTRTLLDDLGYPVKRIDPDGATWTMTRDGEGRLATITDPLNRTTTYTRDGDGYVTAIQNPDGTRATFTYQVGHHALTTAVDELNRTTSYTYTGNGNLETITDAANGVTTLTWSSGLLQTITDPLGRVVTHTYDAYRRLTNALVGGAQTGTMLYDARGYSAGITDPLNATTTIVNDAVGRPVSLTTPDGATTTAMYDAAGLTVGSILPSGLRTSFAYNAAGRQTETIEGVGSGLERRTTSVYDAAGHTLAIIDALGQRTTATYDGVGRVTAVTNPLLETNQTRYDLAGRVSSTLDPLGRVTQFGYDTRDRLVTVTDPLGNITTSVYDAVGNTTAVVDPLGHRSTAVYDALNRVIASVDPLGNRATAVYDSASQLIASIDPLGNRTTTAYDARGNVRTVTDPFLNVTTATYDAADRLIAVTDPLNRTSTSVYDTTGRVIASVDPLGNRTTAVYDSAGRLSASIDPLGNRTTAVYDALDRVSATIDALNQRTTAVYDALDRVIANIDPLEHRTTATFDAANRVVAMTDPLNHTSTVAYDAAGNVLATSDPRGNVTGYAWTGNNLLANVVDPLGNLSTTVYDAASRPVAAIDPLNRTTTAVYDDANRLAAVVDPLGNRTTAAYDAASNLVSVTDALNHTVTSVYDALNRPVATIDALGNRTTAMYDAAGQFVASIDALNRRTTAVYDDVSRLVAVVDPLGNRTTAVYDAASNPVASIDPLNHRTTAVYDALNRPIATIDALGNRATVAFDAAGRVQSVTDPLNHRVTFNYDDAGRNTSILDGLEKTWQTVYDDANNPVAVVDPLGNRTTAVYDADNRVIGHIDALGNRATTVYDAAGQLIATIDPLNQRTTSVYDLAGRLTTSIDALGNRTTAVYDAAGRTSALIDPVGNRTTWTFDAANRMIAETDPLNANRTYAYDAVGQLASATDRLGRRKDYAYDDNGRLSTEKWYAVGGALSQTQTFTYDAAGRLTSAVDPDGAYTLAYDAVNRVEHVDEPFGLALTFAYDGAGNRTGVTDSLGGRTTVTFDARNMQTGEELGGTGITPIKDVRAYDDVGRLASDTRQKPSFGFWTTAVNTTYAYDAVSRLTGITTKDGMSSTLATYAYSYDAASRLTQKIDNGATTTYSYDATWQLTQAGAATYSYDANGNRTLTGYVTGPGNRTTNDGTWTYTYDAEGNVTKKSKGSSSDTWTYGYDHNNQMMTAAFATTDGGSATQRVTYVYDGFGNRIERDAWDGSTATVERYGLDGWDPVKLANAIGNENFEAWADLDGSNALVMRRIYGPEFGAPIARETAGGTVSWYGTDLQGSVRSIFDNSGVPTATITYDSAGRLLSGTPDGYGFGQMQYDSLGSFGVTSRRIYFPDTGRFAQEDPLGLVPDTNRWRYVGNSLTNLVDPSGLQPPPKPPFYTGTNIPIPTLPDPRLPRNEPPIPQSVILGKSADGSLVVGVPPPSDIVIPKPRPIPSLPPGIEPNTPAFWAYLKQMKAADDYAETRSFFWMKVRLYILLNHNRIVVDKWMDEEVCFSVYTGQPLSREEFLRETFLPFLLPSPQGVSVPRALVPTPKTPPVVAPAAPIPRGPKPVTGTTPGSYLDEAVAQQGLPKAPAGGLKQKWSEGGFDYEVRVHPADPAHGKTGSIYRVARRSQARDAHGQGTGWEYMDSTGKWHPESTLKPGNPSNPNPTFNDAAAKDTHIQLPPDVPPP